MLEGNSITIGNRRILQRPLDQTREPIDTKFETGD